MGIKEGLAVKMAMKLVKGMRKEELLIPLREGIKRRGLAGKDAVDAAMENIESSSMKPVFDKLGITRKDIEEAFKKE